LRREAVDVPWFTGHALFFFLSRLPRKGQGKVFEGKKWLLNTSQANCFQLQKERQKNKMNGLNAATFGALCVAASAHVSTHVSTRIYGSKSKYCSSVGKGAWGTKKTPR
jgi:hypothetical protein